MSVCLRLCTPLPRKFRTAERVSLLEIFHTELSSLYNFSDDTISSGFFVMSFRNGEMSVHRLLPWGGEVFKYFLH